VTAAQRPWRRDKAGLRLQLRVTPKSAREGVEGIVATAQGEAIAVRVHAAADKGEANRAVETVIAEWIGVGRTSVAVSAGTKSRLKTVAVAGQPDRLAAVMETRIANLR
jgi:uncharacterized protein (TIGR00251 family)